MALLHDIPAPKKEEIPLHVLSRAKSKLRAQEQVE